MRRTGTEVTNGGTGAAAHLGIDLAEYDARIRTFIPDYETMIGVAASALRLTLTGRAPAIVDLGIGTGALAEACLRAMPAARITGVDGDAGMLAAARGRLGPALTAALHDSFERVAIPPCDAVVASLALHHIPSPARRLRLFRRIHRALRPRGVLISADCYPSSNARLAADDRAAWIAHLEETYTPAEARQYLRAWAREDHYALLTDEVAMLRRAGFTVDVRGRRHAFAVVVASRSAVKKRGS